MSLDPNIYNVIDPEDVEPRKVRPHYPMTEWTGRCLIDAIQGSSTSAGGGAAIPNFDFIDLTDHYGSTNNIKTVIYKVGGTGGTEVARWTLTYVHGAVSNDDDIATAALTIA